MWEVPVDGREVRVITMTLADVAAAVGGSLDAADAAAVVTGPVVVDSRDVAPGGLFVARAGELRDGHDFAVVAVDAGAVAVLAERPVGVPAVVTDDSEQALGRLARYVADRLIGQGMTVVGVTGSSGKTSTKDMLAHVLEPLGSTMAPQGSYNTEVGVPLTVLRADESTRTLVIEMGARGVGHIAYLCGIAPPHVGVVLNVGTAHVGEFGDRETTARAKGELIEALPDGGTAVLNADDALVRGMAERADEGVRTEYFGTSVHADVRAEGMMLDDHGRAAFDLVTPDGRARVQLSLVGAHQVSNALAVAAVATTMGMPVTDVASGLASATPRSRWRMEVTTGDDGVTVVNDAYNANPESTRAALDALVHLGRSGGEADDMGGARRTWAVLGEMLELGDRSAAEHESVGRYAARLGVVRLVAVGEGARDIVRGVEAEPDWSGTATWVSDHGSALTLLREQLRRGDIVLVKASRATGLERLAEELTAARTRDRRPAEESVGRTEEDADS